jgi:hypothetical protein
MKNRIINGDMRIDQRNAGASVVASAGNYTLDRWNVYNQTDGAFTVQQVSTAPAGFTNSVKITITSADTSLATAQYSYIRQCIEGFNTADLGWGTASAKTVTLSFWVQSSVTGTFSGAVSNDAYTRGYPFTYTISTANTWEFKTVTIAGSTDGTWPTNNTGSLQLLFSLGTGTTQSGTAGVWGTTQGYVGATDSAQFIGTNGATLFITGVQLEKGSTATQFDYRSYGTELSLCQRYYWRNTSQEQYQPYAGGYTYSSTSFTVFIPFPVSMRTKVTGIGVSASDAFFVQNTGNFTTSAVTFNRSSLNACSISFTISGATAGQAGNLLDRVNGSWIEFTGAEL